MGKTSIGWTDFSFNPWVGCTKVSAACDNCYAEGWAKRAGRDVWGHGKPRQRTTEANWREPLKWNAAAKAAGIRKRVFCASLADVFDNEVEEHWRRDLFKLIEATPALTWLLLTKRIGNVAKMTDPMRGNPLLPRNVALGATMANQEEYDRDRFKLADAKRVCGPLFTFASLEPLLGPVILDSYAPDWIIVGGESGSVVRPMKVEWARSLRDQCARLKRSFFFKQWGGRTPDAGGKLLDGREHQEFPTP